MCRMRCRIIVLVVGLVVCCPVAVRGDESSAFAERILSLVDVVTEKHIDPPIRQQMILSAARALYESQSQTVPRGLSKRLSKLVTHQELAKFLDSLATDFGGADGVEEIVTRGLLASIPGGAELVDGDASRVQGQLLANRYVGTGIALGMNVERNLPNISKVFYGGPASKAGIKPGDLLLGIDDESTDDLSLKDVVQRLRGDAGETVTMVVQQPGEAESRSLEVTRDRVFIPAVESVKELPKGEWKYTLDAAEDVAYLRVKTLGPSTVHELRTAEAKLRGKQLSGLIIDLRTAGGTLHETVLVADSLMDGGKIGSMQSLESKQDYVARPGALFPSLPMVVVMGQFAGPGPVFLAAALQDNGRAIVVGKPNAGDTYVRSMVSVPNCQQDLRLAVGVLHRGDGTPLLAPVGAVAKYKVMQAEQSDDRKTNVPARVVIPDHLVASPQDIIRTAIRILRDRSNKG